LHHSQVQPTLSSTFGDCRNATRVTVTTSVKNDFFDAGAFCAFCNELADLPGFGGLVTVKGTEVSFEGGCRREGETLAVVNDLDEYVTSRTGHDETRASRGSVDLLTEARVTTVTGSRLGLYGHGYLPAFPALRRTISPA
jgi:hypothetical protein